MNYTATINKAESGDFRIVLRDESSENHVHTAIECPNLRALLFEASKAIEEREKLNHYDETAPWRTVDD